MRVLIACEFSGVVRRAFAAQGHEAWSCDLLPAEDESQFHVEGNVINHLSGFPTERAIPTGEWGPSNGGRNAQDIQFMDYEKIYDKPWDLLIAHPPCTYLCNSGVRWLAPGGKLNQERHKLMQEACDLFAALYWADVPHVAIENPRTYEQSSTSPRPVGGRQAEKLQQSGT